MSMKEKLLFNIVPEMTPKIADNGKAFSLRSRDYKDAQIVCDARGNGRGGISPTITGDHQNRITDYTAIALTERIETMETVVRRLTPKECERLQGFPDDWTNIGDWVDSKGKKHKNADSPRYKALGNSIALPFWQYLADKMAAQYDKDYEPTMASLFDGIGGFPLVFSRAGVKPVWCSEIEEFPIAVTKIRFPEGDNT